MEYLVFVGQGFTYITLVHSHTFTEKFLYRRSQRLEVTSWSHTHKVLLYVLPCLASEVVLFYKNYSHPFKTQLLLKQIENTFEVIIISMNKQLGQTYLNIIKKYFKYWEIKIYELHWIFIICPSLKHFMFKTPNLFLKEVLKEVM